MEIIPFVKYWMPHIVVLKPTRISEATRRDLDEYLKIEKAETI
jgi:hypothetical protein